MGPGRASLLLLLLLGCLAAPLAAAARTPLQLRRLAQEAQEQPVPAEFVVTNDTLSALLERTGSPGKAVIFTTTRRAGRKGLRRPGSGGGSAGPLAFLLSPLLPIVLPCVQLVQLLLLNLCRPAGCRPTPRPSWR